MIWISGLVMIALAMYLVLRLPVSDRGLFIAGLAAKCVAGIALGVVYFYYYDGHGDTLQYWEESATLSARMVNPAEAWNILWSDLPDPSLVAQGVHGVPRSFFFSKIAAIVSWLSGGNYWIMSVVFSFVSFIAAWTLFTRLQAYRVSAAAALFFFPSVVFWSSGLIKECLGLAAIYVVVSLFLDLYRNGRISYYQIVIGLLGIWVGWNLKYYWLGILAPVLLAVLVVAFLKRWRHSLQSHEMTLGGVALAVMMVVATGGHPNFYPDRIASVIVESNAAFIRFSDPPGVIHFGNLQPTAWSLAVHAPEALFACLFRPCLGEASDLLSWLAAIENAVVFLLLLSALRSVGQGWKSPERLLVGATAIYVTLLAIFLALSSPNLGTLSRYKVGFLPFLVLLLLEANPGIRKALGRLIPG
jgi:hypothetical protein